MCDNVYIFKNKDIIRINYKEEIEMKTRVSLIFLRVCNRAKKVFNTDSYKGGNSCLHFIKVILASQDSPQTCDTVLWNISTC